MPKERILSYDIFRGILLVVMVVFHIFANLTALRFDHRLFYFVPVGFVLFLGVVLGRFLVGTTKKKVGLGVKLLLLFLALNIPNFISKDFSLATFLHGSQEIFSFEILFPMSLLVFATIGLDRVKRWWKVLFVGGCLVLIAANYFSSIEYNLSLLLYGLLGYSLALGLDIDMWAKTHTNWQYISLAFFVIVLSCLIYGLVEVYATLLVLQIGALYFFTAIVIKKSKTLAFLGKHSLVLYVAHIFVIRLMAVFMP